MKTMLWRPSPNYNERKTPLDMIIIHYTDMASAQDALERMCDAASEVSAHYLIGKDGQIYQMVKDEMRAWHAGVSSWEGESDINSRSIGIELDNGGETQDYPPFPGVQIETLIDLCHSLIAKHNILPTRIIGHSDVAPGRKKDPGPQFPWDLLNKNGLGIG